MSDAHGKWNVTVKTPMGEKAGVLDLRVKDGTLTGSISGGDLLVSISNGRIQGDRLNWSARIEKPIRITCNFSAIVDGNRISGKAKYMLGSAAFSGTRIV